jgi:hypothetical protein
MFPMHLELNPVSSTDAAAPAVSDAIATDARSYTRESSLGSDLIIVVSEKALIRTTSCLYLLQI